MRILLILVLVATLLSCAGVKDSDKLYVYEVDGIHYIIGYGAWDKDGMFHIQDIDGQLWEIPSTAAILRSEVTKESFSKRTH